MGFWLTFMMQTPHQVTITGVFHVLNITSARRIVEVLLLSMVSRWRLWFFCLLICCNTQVWQRFHCIKPMLPAYVLTIQMPLYAFWMLCFAVMVGQNLDSELTVHLVPCLNWNELSVDWLASQSMKSICGMLGPLGQRPNFAKMLCSLVIAIHDHHGGVVPNNEEDLEQLLGVDY